MKKMKKSVVAVLSVALVAAIGVSATVAWLTDKTETITNTFTVGDINIGLAETTGTAYTFVPGDVIAKDPKVAVLANSEDCYLFVKVVEANNYIEDAANDNQIIDWDVDESVWTPVTGHAGYWYKEVNASTAAQPFDVFTDSISDDGKDGSVTVSGNLTKAMIKAEGFKAPEISITAAAVQKDNVANVDDAWTKLPTEFTAA